jgi:hypothetical protein
MADDSSPTRFFTPDEADAALPSVRASIDRAARLLARAKSLAEGLEQGQPEGGRRQEDIVREIQRATAELNEAVSEITGLGAEVKGLENGLVDFPALYRGQHVYLCWKHGEDRVAFWHALHTGFPGRRPVDRADLGAWEWLH